MGKVSVKKYRFIEVYQPKKKGAKYRKTNIGHFKNLTGVYFIKEFKGWNRQSAAQRKANKGQIVYVGAAGLAKNGVIPEKADLYKTILRHFQYWKERSFDAKKGLYRYHVSYKSYYDQKTGRLIDKMKNNRYTVGVSVINNQTKGGQKKIEELEEVGILQFLPRDNRQKKDRPEDKKGELIVSSYLSEREKALYKEFTKIKSKPVPKVEDVAPF